MNLIKKKSAAFITAVILFAVLFSIAITYENKVSADITESDFEVIGGIEETDYRYIPESNQLEILSNEILSISMKSDIETSIKDSILLNDGSNVTISNVSIKNSSISNAAITVASNASVSLDIDGNNSLISTSLLGSGQAGVRVPSGSSITISGSGSLYAEGANNAAAIGSSTYFDGENNKLNDLGSITIDSGNISVKGGSNSAGIGGGSGSMGGNININGGTVSAIGGSNAAGIGTGLNNNSGSIYITDGNITATGGAYAPGIGTGYKSNYGDVEIAGGVINASGGEYGSGIGSGYNLSQRPCTLTISGGIIESTGGKRGAGIGMSNTTYNSSGSVNISGGVIDTTGGTYGAGIGYSGKINIDNGSIKTTGGRYAAGIGGSSWVKTGGMLNVSGGSIMAQGGLYAAGIGGAYDGSGGTVVVNGGKIIARGGNSAAGIGGGEYGQGANISINGGTVLAYGFDKKEYSGAGIGGGYRGAGNTTAIKGGFVTADGGTGAEDIGDGDRYVGSKTFVSTINGGSVWAVDGKINSPSGTKSNNGEPVYPVFIAAKENKTNTSTLNKDLVVDKYNYIARTVSSLDANCEHSAAFAAAYPGVASIIYLPKDNFVNGIEIGGLPQGFADVKTVSSYKTKTNTAYWNVTQAGIFAIQKGTEGKDYKYDNNIVTLLNGADVKVGLYKHDVNTGDDIVISQGAVANLQISSIKVDNSGAGNEPVKVGPNSTLNLSLDGVNKLNGADNRAAISVGAQSTLNISGTGGLAAKGGSEAAALGANYGDTAGKTVIKSGFVTADGGGASDIDNPVIDGGSVWFVSGSDNIPKNSAGIDVYPIKVPAKNPLSQAYMYGSDIKVANSTYKARTVSAHKNKCEHGENFPEDLSALLYLPSSKKYSISVGSYANGNVSVASDRNISSINNKVNWTFSMRLNVSSRNVENRSSYKLSAIFTPSYVKNKAVTWTSSDTRIATVSGGKVTPKKLGTVYITAKSSFNGAVTARAKIKVISPVTSIAVPQSKIYLTKKKTYTVPYVAYTKDGSKAKVTWRSSNKKIATVNSKGKISAKKTGKCTVTVKAENGKYKKISVKVVRSTKKISSITIKKAPKSIKKGAQKRLYAKLKSASSTNAKVTWSSSNSKVLSVDKSGLIKAKKKGKATIKVKAGGKSKTVKIKVN